MWKRTRPNLTVHQALIPYLGWSLAKLKIGSDGSWITNTNALSSVGDRRLNPFLINFIANSGIKDGKLHGHGRGKKSRLLLTENRKF